MTTLLVGFDSAWTPTNSGAIAGVLRRDDGTFQDFGPPQCVDYPGAEAVILGWQAQTAPNETIVLLDQPTIVRNAGGQRPVENIVGASVSLRHGGMQPANTGKTEMFGPQAPMWPFLASAQRPPPEQHGRGTPCADCATAATPSLITATVTAAADVAAGKTMMAASSTRVATLAEEAMKTMLVSKLRSALMISAIAFLALIPLGGALLRHASADIPVVEQGDRIAHDQEPAPIQVVVTAHLYEVDDVVYKRLASEKRRLRVHLGR